MSTLFENSLLLNARYFAPAFEGTTLRYRIENVSGDDLRVGYRVFDFPSGVLMSEEKLAALPQPAHGAAFDVAIPLALPGEPGNYRIYSSLVDGDGSWSYEAGSPFISAEIAIAADGEVRLHKVEITNLEQHRRSERLRAIPSTLLLPFRTVWHNRRLSYTLTKREILSRSRGSFGGALWTILNPLLLMSTYFFVFGLVLKSRFENDPRPSSFALYFLAGMLPWLAFSEAAGRAPTLLIEYRQLIRKLVFPIEMLPVNLVFSGLVGEAFGLALFLLAVLLIRGHLAWTLLYLPFLLIPQMLFTVGVCWFLSALGAFLRDLAQVNGFFLTLWFFVTPICYPENQLPAGARPLLTRNPIFILVKAYRAILLQGRPPEWRSLVALSAFSLLFAMAAHAWFYKLKKSFADIL